MMGWFMKKKKPEDYENVLAVLELDIQKRRTRLSEIRLRERRTSLALTLYACAIWVLYVATWYTGILQKYISTSRSGQLVFGTSVFFGPVIIQLARRLVQVWFSRIEAAEEKNLKELLLQQRSKLKELREKTNFNTVRDLLDRYSDPTATPQRSFTVSGMVAPQVMQRRVMPPQQKLVQSSGTAMPASSAAGPPMPSAPPKMQWYDKLADVLLGEDSSTANKLEYRYALICQKCFTHNGMVPPNLYELTQYTCPKCGHFNPAPRSISGSIGLSTSKSSEGMSASPTDMSISSMVPPGQASLSRDPNTQHFQDALAAATMNKAARSRMSIPAPSTPEKNAASEGATFLHVGGDTESQSRKSMPAQLAQPEAADSSNNGSPNLSATGDTSSSADMSVDNSIQAEGSGR